MEKKKNRKKVTILRDSGAPPPCNTTRIVLTLAKVAAPRDAALAELLEERLLRISNGQVHVVVVCIAVRGGRVRVHAVDLGGPGHGGEVLVDQGKLLRQRGDDRQRALVEAGHHLWKGGGGRGVREGCTRV